MREAGLVEESDEFLREMLPNDGIKSIGYCDDSSDDEEDDDDCAGRLFSLWELFGKNGKNGKNERSAAPSSSRLPLALCVRSGQFKFFFFKNGDVACRNRVDAVLRNGQRVATVSKKFDFSDTPRGVSDAVSGRVGTYRRVGERPTLHG
ncbi:hypothetical protein ACLB2K_073555 [Fragaria x ananassa]